MSALTGSELYCTWIIYDSHRPPNAAGLQIDPVSFPRKDAARRRISRRFFDLVITVCGGVDILEPALDAHLSIVHLYREESFSDFQRLIGKSPDRHDNMDNLKCSSLPLLVE